MFITFEGNEGTGKSTAIKHVQKWLKEEGFDVVVTREPGGVEIAEKIREIILDRSHTAMDPRTEALLYAAARRQHLVEVVLPALEKKKIVLCDRFIDSSLAYQGHARGLGIDEILTINQFAIDKKMPDLTIFFDMDPIEGLQRISKNKDREINRLDLEKEIFHHEVYEGYKKVCKRFKRIQKIDASKSEKDVADQIIDILKKKLKHGKSK